MSIADRPYPQLKTRGATLKHYSRNANRPLWLWAILMLGLLLPASLMAQPTPGSLQVQPRHDLAEIGRNLELEITVVPPSDRHLSSSGWTVEVITEGDGFLDEAYPIKTLTPGRVTDSSNPSSNTRFEWVAPILENSAVGPRVLKVSLHGTWDDGTPAELTWTGTIQVDFGDEWTADRITSYIENKGLALFLLAVFGFGLLMSLSPCIYPMIPITLAVIGARSQEKGPAHGLMLSVTYVIGMALVYAILGALSATVFSGITAFMQSPAVLVPIALLMAALSLSMFGAYELEAPAFLRDKLQGQSGGKSGNLLGVLLMGMVAGLVASPCVGPFLAALLIWVATTGNVVLGFISLFTFGIGMGMLLIGVGTFPALLGSMPSSGGWMVTVRNGMGLILLAMAFYFVRPGAVLAASYFYPLLGITTVLIAVFMGAFDTLTAETHWWGKVRKGLGICVLLAGVLILLLGFSYHFPTLIPPTTLVGSETVASLASPTRAPDSILPAAQESQTLSVNTEVEFSVVKTGYGVRNFLDQKRAEAKAAGKPMVIDFWASWCVYCKKLDKHVWHNQDVATEAQRFVAVKVDATAPDDSEMAAIKEEFMVPGLPRVVFIDSRGKVLHGLSSGYQSAEKMLATMQGVR